MGRRPHRRDRRRPAGNTRGGATNALNFLQDFNWLDSSTYQLKVVRINNDPLTNGSVDEPITGVGSISTEGIKAMVAGSPVTISIASVTAPNIINLVFSSPQASALTLVFMPFNPEFRGLTGTANAGGFVLTSAPPP